MNKKNSVKGRLKIVMIIILSVLMIALIVICARKVMRIQNGKNIIGTWMQGNLEEVFTFQDNGSLIVNQDMPEIGISRGGAHYEFVYMNIIRVTQGEDGVEFEIKVNKNQLTIFFNGLEYLVLQKQ